MLNSLNCLTPKPSPTPHPPTPPKNIYYSIEDVTPEGVLNKKIA
jgi:hypothetical protein